MRVERARAKKEYEIQTHVALDDDKVVNLHSNAMSDACGLVEDHVQAGKQIAVNVLLTSTGGGMTTTQEFLCGAFSGRGGANRGESTVKSPIVDDAGNAPGIARQNLGPDFLNSIIVKDIANCEHSEVAASQIEESVQEHLRGVASESNGDVSILWRRDGWGGPKGMGPYIVSIAVVPLPLPNGMKISITQPWEKGT